MFKGGRRHSLLSFRSPAVGSEDNRISAESMAAGGTGSLLYREIVPHLSKWSMMDELLVAI